MIKYFIKFTKNEEWAKDLIAGKLYMNTPRFFHDLEEKYGPGQGDKKDGVPICGPFFFNKNLDALIYCLYSVDDDDIQKSRIVISDQVVHDFECENGYLVIIDAKLFHERLKTCNTRGYQLEGGRVLYGTPSCELFMKLFVSKDLKHLLIKRQCFQHQKEYRLLLYRTLLESKDNEPDCAQGTENSQEEQNEVEDKHSYYISSGLCDITKPLVSVNNLAKTNGGYILNLRDVHA